MVIVIYFRDAQKRVVKGGILIPPRVALTNGMVTIIGTRKLHERPGPTVVYTRNIV